MKILKNRLALTLICLTATAQLHSANLFTRSILPKIKQSAPTIIVLLAGIAINYEVGAKKQREANNEQPQPVVAYKSTDKKLASDTESLCKQFNTVSTIIRKSTKDIERFWGINTPLPLDIKDNRYDLSELKKLSSLSSTPFLQILHSLWYPSVSFKPQSGKFAGKSLHFIRARHRKAEKDRKHDAFLEHIKRVIETEKPDLIIIEGILTHLGFLTSPSPQQNLHLQNMEHLKTLSIASEHNIPCIGGEPSELVTTQAVLKHRFKKYIAFSVPGLASNYDDYKNQFSKHTANLNTYEKKNFAYLWMKQYQKYDIKHKKNKNTPIDINYDKKLYNDLKVYARDRHILNLIFHALKQYNKVLIVYGNAHFFTQEGVLKKHLGEPKNSSNTYYDQKEIEQPTVY